MKYLFLIIILFVQLNIYGQSIAPDFTLIDTQGVSRNLYSELDSGKIIILDFFITNCGTCQINSITLEDIWQTYGYNGDSVWVWGIEVSGISDSVLEVFDNQYSVTFPTFSTEFDDIVAVLYSITYTPQYYVVCPAHFMKQIPIEAVVPNIIECPDAIQNNEIILNDNKTWFIDEKTNIYLKLSLENFPLDLNIYNSIGVKVFSEKVFDTNKVISLQNKTSGLYFISLKNKSGNFMNGKFIVH